MATPPDLAASAAHLAQPVLNAHDTQVLIVAAWASRSSWC
jgi:hypothetical protein